MTPTTQKRRGRLRGMSAQVVVLRPKVVEVIPHERWTSLVKREMLLNKIERMLIEEKQKWTERWRRYEDLHQAWQKDRSDLLAMLAAGATVEGGRLD
jgi:EAL domain-containing protein (putative c-di-GMP-specific phosphodiesterase class I)